MIRFCTDVPRTFLKFKLKFTALYGRAITRSLKTVKICYLKFTALYGRVKSVTNCYNYNFFYQQYPEVTINLLVNHFLDDILNHF